MISEYYSNLADYCEHSRQTLMYQERSAWIAVKRQDVGILRILQHSRLTTHLAGHFSCPGGNVGTK